jgi:hypothetical protein
MAGRNEHKNVKIDAVKGKVTQEKISDRSAKASRVPKIPTKGFLA